MRSSKWLVGAFAVSLALNLALIGFVAGRASVAGYRHLAPDPSLGAFRMVRQLPEERRQALRPLMREHFRDLRPKLQQLQAVQTKVRDALDADPFEPAALERALGEFRAALLATQEHSHRGLVQLAANLTRDERRQLLSAMTWDPGRHRDASSHHPQPPGPPPEGPHQP
jgi:uncharacterized membrane protein